MDEYGTQINMTLHSRPISIVRFYGDFLFAGSLDNIISVWNLNGELIGTYEGHRGAVWSLDFGNFMASGGSDRKLILWDIVSGRILKETILNSTVKGISIYENGCLLSCDNSYNSQSMIGYYDKRNNKIIETYYPQNVATQIINNFINNNIYYSDETGLITQIDIRNKKIIKSEQVHDSKITELRKSKCGSYFISSSFDMSSKILDFDLNVIKNFISNDPVNSSVVNSGNDKMLNAGGIPARDVTVTESNKQFDVCFYDIVSEKYVGCYSTHFGTINSVDVYEDLMYASGGEDGILCMIKFGNDFRMAPFTSLVE